MSNEFKDGDLVYFPPFGTRIFTLSRDGSETYPLIIDNGRIDESFTVNGLVIPEHDLPSIFLATDENRNLLEALYGTAFEHPSNHEHYKIADLLKQGKMVLCMVSKRAGTLRVPKIIKGYSHDSLKNVWSFEDVDEDSWGHARLVDKNEYTLG